MTVRLPLRNRAGEVVAHALIDDDDAERVSVYRWHRGHHSYVFRTVYLGVRDGKRRWSKIGLHREIMRLKFRDGLEVDHINHDPLDNRKANLRVLPHQRNTQNRRAHADAASPHRGVSPHRASGRWQAHITTMGRRRYLGLFDTEEQAAAAVDAALLQASVA